MPLDTNAGLCQTVTVNASIARNCANEQVGRLSKNSPVIKSSHGGSRPGAGRKPKFKPQPTYEADRARWFCVRTTYDGEITADMALRAAGFARDAFARPARPYRLVTVTFSYTMAGCHREDESGSLTGILRITINICGHAPVPAHNSAHRID